MAGSALTWLQDDEATQERLRARVAERVDALLRDLGLIPHRTELTYVARRDGTGVQLTFEAACAIARDPLEGVDG